MDDEFFTCGECQDSKHDEKLNHIPEELHFSEKQIFDYATRWSNCILAEDVDFGPVDDVDCFNLRESVIDNNSSYLDLLDESFDISAPQLDEE